MKFKSIVFTTVLGALVTFGNAGAAQAKSADRYRDDACARKIYNEERALDRAIEHHGFNSRQADHERFNLERTRAACRVPEYR
jgi:hypothetical protein